MFAILLTVLGNLKRRLKVGAEGFKCTPLSTLIIVSLMALAILLLSVGSSSASPGGLTPRAPIGISGNDGFIPASGVTSGSGTENDPYIIENWAIDASTGHGIWIQNTTAHFIIRNCLVKNGDYGIYLKNVVSGRVENCVFSNNSNGIYLSSSSNNLISNNTCSSNGYGIILYHSSSNTFSNNIFEDCGIWIGGYTVSHFNSHVMENNTVNGKPLYYYADNTGIVVPADAGQVILANCSNMTIENINASNTSVGVKIAFTENSLVKNNILSNNAWSSINLYSSSSNILDNNTCSNNYFGICLSFSSNNNTLSNNTCSNNHRGIYLQWSSSNNTIFHNYLLNNTENNAYDDDTNYWDNGSEGNYWSDWQLPAHPDADEDGIVDTPRPIAGGTNQDSYPLVMGVIRVIYYPNIIYQNVKSCIFTPGGGVWTEPILNTIGEYRTDIEGFNRGEIGVLEIVENFLVQRVEIYGSGCQPPVTLTVNEITKSVTLFHDEPPYGNETIVFDITPSKKVTIYTSIHTGDYNHGFGIKWIKLIGSADTTPPAAPTLISPANGSTTSDTTPTFDWSDVADPSGVTYTLEIIGALTKTGLTASTYTLTGAEALADGTYSWHVRAVDGAGNVGEWSATWSLTIETPVTARIDCCSAEPREVKVGENSTLELNFTNIGDTAWTFYAAASLRKPNGEVVHLPMKSVTLDPSQRGSAEWSYTIDMKGSWDVAFEVWKESSQETSLCNTGWLTGYITGKEVTGKLISGIILVVALIALVLVVVKR